MMHSGQSGQHAISRRAFLGTAGLALAGSLAGCGVQEAAPAEDPAPQGPRTLDEIRSSGPCNVGISSDNRPLAGIDGTGNYGGIDDYFCLYFTERTGMGVNYVSVDPRDRYDKLLSGEIDFCVSLMSPSDDRAAEAAFGHPVYQLQLALVSSKSAPVESADQLSQGKLIVCEGSYAEQYAREMWPEVKLRTYPSLASARTALEDGKGIALLDDEIPLVWWLKEHTAFTMGVTGIGEPRRLAPAVAAGCDEMLGVLLDVTEDFIDTSWSKRAYNFVVMPDIGEAYASMLCKLENPEA